MLVAIGDEEQRETAGQGAERGSDAGVAEEAAAMVPVERYEFEDAGTLPKAERVEDFIEEEGVGHGSAFPRFEEALLGAVVVDVGFASQPLACLTKEGAQVLALIVERVVEVKSDCLPHGNSGSTGRPVRG